MRFPFGRRGGVAGLAFAFLATLVTIHAAQSQSALTVVRAVGPPNDGYKAVYWGVKSGIFKKYGLDVQTMPTC